MKPPLKLKFSLIPVIGSGSGWDLPFRLQAGLSILPLLFALGIPLSAAQVRVPSGTLVRIILHYDLTTENVDKGDRVEFDVADDVAVNNRVVIPRGAAAWGQVTKVKGSGKKKAKDASVTFKLMTVRAVDNQDIPLRASPSKSKKPDSKENEIEANSPIPGLREKMFGAEKGREYAAYTDLDATINAPEGTTAVAPTPAPPATPAPPSAPAPPLPPPTSVPVAPGLVEIEGASIEFNSTPPGADILIDGTFVGNTPSTLRVAPGRHAIEVRLAGYRPWTRTMLVGPGSHPSIRAPLEKE